MSSSIPVVTLSNGVSMPPIQLGTFRTRGTSTVLTSVRSALKAGYRAVDTAAVYRNHQDIALALDSVLPQLDLDRSDVFITSKLDPRDHGQEKCGPAIEKIMTELKVQYLDLFLIHWPGVRSLDVKNSNNRRLRSESWKVLEDFYKRGKLRSIGVSNYTETHMKELIEECDVLPHVQQIELHPHYQQTELVKYCQEMGIHVQAYSSLGQAGEYSPLFQSDVVREIAKQHDKSPAQVLLRWGLQHGYSVLPKSTNPDHIRENIDLDFYLTAEDMDALDGLDSEEEARKYAWDPSCVL